MLTFLPFIAQSGIFLCGKSITVTVYNRMCKNANIDLHKVVIICYYI